METNPFKSESAYSTSSSMIRGIQTGDEYQWSRFCALYGSLVRYWCGREKGQFTETDIDEYYRKGSLSRFTSRLGSSIWTVRIGCFVLGCGKLRKM